MKKWKIIAGISSTLAAAAAVAAGYELKALKSTYYDIGSEKIKPADRLKVVLLTDLHERNYGKSNAKLIRKIAKEKPDLILTGGDMITASDRPDYESSIALYQTLLHIAPVYAAFGNHEKRMSQERGREYRAFRQYMMELKAMGVVWLLNDEVKLNSSITLSGLDIDRRYYKKIRREYYPLRQMKQDLASVPKECFNIVLAHNPRFFNTYAQFGADLYLSGHYHGGAVRLFGGRVGVISPQFRMFPKYSKGLYAQDGAHMIVSGGCGSHKVNLRLHNKPEIVVINIHGHLI